MKNKKSLIALVALLVVGVVGVTFAYYTSTKTFENSFTTGEYGTIIREKFDSPENWAPGDLTEKIVNVKNTGNVPVVARVTVEEAWTSKGGNTLSTEMTVNGSTEKIALFTPNSSWVKNDTDNKYYYNAILNKNDVSANFIESVTFNPNFSLVEGRDIECVPGTDTEGYSTQTCTSIDTGYAGANYTLTITVETIQADAATAENKWYHNYN